jgi:peroxiredoxin
MKYLPLLVAAFAFPLCSSARLAAQIPQSATPPPATSDATSDAFTRYNAAFARITDKVKELGTGTVTADDIAAELQEMDAILAENANNKSEAFSMLYLMRARVCIELLEDYPKGLELLKQVKADFPKTYSQAQVGKIVASVEEKMSYDYTLYIGKPFPVFSEKDIHGKAVSTAKLKGKIVLVSFWASFSNQCIADLNPQLELYRKYHDKGFEIIGISADEDRNDLKALVAKKNIPWPQYCDGRGWKGSVVRQYGVAAVPFSVLLDRDSKVIGKNLKTPALEQKLAKLFGE